MMRWREIPVGALVEDAIYVVGARGDAGQADGKPLLLEQWNEQRGAWEPVPIVPDKECHPYVR